MNALYIGLMSGTSLDGTDGVLVDFSSQPLRVVTAASEPFCSDLRAELLALNTPSHNELHRACVAANALAAVSAQVVQRLLAQAAPLGISAAHVKAIGAHGQTVRHQPERTSTSPSGAGYTLQLNNPALLAEMTGMEVIADFRSRDVAAGGQGAPLVPAFHQSIFGQADRTVLVLNLGGISNLSILPPPESGPVLGFDCGPGNALMDAWCQQHTGQSFDAGGAWAASGKLIPSLLASLLDEPYLATLTEFTAAVCIMGAGSYQKDSNELIVCGGGVLNLHLMQRLQAGLPELHVGASSMHGMPPLQVEAAAFAWLAMQTQHRLPGNLANVTGAKGARVLGAIYPA